MMVPSTKGELALPLPLLNVQGPNMLNARMAYGPRAREVLGQRDVADWARHALPQLSLTG